MKFVFDYEETLIRRVSVDAPNLGDAITAIHKMIDNETLVLNSEDFVGGRLTLPLGENNPYYVRVEKYGKNVKDASDLDIVIEEW